MRTHIADSETQRHRQSIPAIRRIHALKEAAELAGRHQPAAELVAIKDTRLKRKGKMETFGLVLGTDCI